MTHCRMPLLAAASATLLAALLLLPHPGAAQAARPAPPALPVRSTPCPGPEAAGLGEALSGSIGGHYDPQCHTPLGLDNFGTGWLDPWIPVGAGSSGALRGG